jgi:hypothetical protein
MRLGQADGSDDAETYPTPNNPRAGAKRANHHLPFNALIAGRLTNRAQKTGPR